MALSLLASAAAAQTMAPSPWTPAKVAAAIDKEASATSFGQLVQFGRQSLRLPSAEQLPRLNHVAWLLLNQSEFAQFATWNDAMAREARRVSNRRYEQTAELNALRARWDQGETSAMTPIERIGDHDPDWFVRVQAMSIMGYMLIHNAEVGEALRMLAEADSLVPDKADGAKEARSRIWESEGLALMRLRDLKASAAAFGRSQFEFGSAGYPRPDFDPIYNMASLAGQLGDRTLAFDLANRHHRLAQRAGVPGLSIWDRNLCAEVAGLKSPHDVLRCLQGLTFDNSDARQLEPQLLRSRALAYARLGDVAEAEADVARLQTLQASGRFSAAQFDELPRLEAAVLHAKGQDAAAYRTLAAFYEAHAFSEAQRTSAGISQLTTEMQKQLGQRREQLVTARRNADLQHDVIATQNLLEVIGGVVTLSVFVLLLWQWRVGGQLRRARQAADAANRAKSDFLANMSHEIRTPLNGVVAVADMLARSDLPPQQREMAEIIRASGDTLQRLLSDILDVARIESGKITLEAAPFHVGQMVRAVAALSQLKCDEKGVGLVVEVAPEAELTVVGDQVRVRQVVTNLLSNAAKFTERGEIRLQVARMETGSMRFTVTDTGVGFDMAHKGKVLGRFEQADSSITRRFGGTGLGLSICCDLAVLMGGVLDCESEQGVGSRFWMEIPLTPAEAERASDVAAAGVIEAAAQDERPLRVLLADDHPTNRKVVELMLPPDVAELVSVENGAEAVAAFETGVYDVILMDMQMPVMDGITAIHEIRRREAIGGMVRTPIVMLTANALPEHVTHALAAGADLHLAKPFTAPALFDVIANALPEPQAAAA